MRRSKTTTTCWSCCFPTWRRATSNIARSSSGSYYARANVEIQQQSFQLATDKFENGATTERDTHQAKQVLEETEALIPALEIGKRQAANGLCVLLGMPPTDMDAILGTGSGMPVTPPDVVVGVPADLVRRRPDVRRAERQVAAQSARIGVAVSDLLPALQRVGNDRRRGRTIRRLVQVGQHDRRDQPRFSLGHLELRPTGEQRPRPGRPIPSSWPTRIRTRCSTRAAKWKMRSSSFCDRRSRRNTWTRASPRQRELSKSPTNNTTKVWSTSRPSSYFESTLTEQQDELAVAQGDIALGFDCRVSGAGRRLADSLGTATAQSLSRCRCRCLEMEKCRLPRRRRTTSSSSRSLPSPPFMKAHRC